MLLDRVVIVMCSLSLVFELYYMITSRRMYERIVHFVVFTAWCVSVYHIINTL